MRVADAGGLDRPGRGRVGGVTVAPAAAVLDAAYALARPALFRLEPERAHELVLLLLRLASRSPAALRLLRRLLGVDDPRGAVELFGLRFANPIGLAAGIDKNAVAVPAWWGLGFGHVEVGAVTPLAQPGNPRPRVFRLVEERALINRMGFPNEGAAAVAARLARRPAGLSIVVGANVGKGRDTPLERAADDYEQVVRALLPHADYVSLNVSSPNTAGLRDLQAPEHVASLLGRLRPLVAAGGAGPARPLLLKVAPDLDAAALAEVVAAAREGGAAGIVATNTTVERAGLVPPGPTARQAGGLSGAPLRARSLAVVERLVDLAGSELPVVAAGGVFSAADVQAYLAAGARLVQVFTGLVYRGPALLAHLLDP